MRRLLLAALVALAFSASASAQISPGPLARAHQSLDGTTQCARCHGPSTDAMPRLCLGCHREVAWLVAQRRGVHVREAKTSGRSCGSCHPDHAGREFAMIAWPVGGPARFDHRGAGWALEGKHVKVACEKCHRSEYRVGSAAALSPRKGAVGWVGLETACASCHRRDDPHTNSLGLECQRCHDATGWTPVPRFSHAESRYPLTGKHGNVACDKCHLAASLGIPMGLDGKRAPHFRPITFTECSNCHVDPHRGQLSARCSSCHVTRGFDMIDRRDFNHSVTRYPLLGKHRVVSCEACHGRAMARPKPAFGSCAGCHADSHGGEAALDGARVDCDGCHRVEGFRPATFTLVQHQRTGFPVSGKHARLACASCHTTTTAQRSTTRVTHLRVAAADCVACHVDPHAGQLSGATCASCHSDAEWSTVTFDRAAHARTRLPLEGAHAALSCAGCHGSVRPGLPATISKVASGKAGVTFRIAEVRCASCHADPHRNATGAATGDSTARCEQCHNSIAFRPAAVDIAAHAHYAFTLGGAHRAVACSACHSGLGGGGRTAGGGRTLIGNAATNGGVPLRAVRGTTCAACHQSPHGEQFANRADGGRCDACHGADSFTGVARFDHNRETAFSLAGAHSRVACDRCHRSETGGGTTRVVYRPLAHRCEDCHATKPTGRQQ